MAKPLPAIDEVNDLFAQSVDPLIKHILRIAQAEFEADDAKLRLNIERFGEFLAKIQAIADMLGRRRILLEVNHILGKRIFAEELNVPRVPFQQAIDDIVSRQPRLARNAEEVARIYTRERGIAFARAASLNIVRRVQDAIAKSIRAGEPIEKASEIIQQVGNWSRAYAETVYRTNLSSAYTAGRFKQAQEPDIEDVTPAFEYSAILDSDVRPNHAAADGLIAGKNDPIWARLAPPLGYNCRCSLLLVDRDTLRRKRMLTPTGEVRRARIPFGAAADEGFIKINRPDIEIYGA